MARVLLRSLFISVLTGLLTGALLVLLVLLLTRNAWAGEITEQDINSVERGSLFLRTATGESIVDAPELATDVQMDISGMLARVRVKQNFRNISDQWQEGIYVFPLPDTAAVDHLRLWVGERFIEGEIREKQVAEKLYQEARVAGKRASLLSQQRPNVFTTSVANIAPGEEITVEIEYQQDLHYEAGEFSIRFPMVVAPRYIPGNPLKQNNAGFNGSGWARNTDQVPDAEQITPLVSAEVENPLNPVTILVNLHVGFDLAYIDSPYHPVVASGTLPGEYEVRLQNNSVSANRDFELRWQPAQGRAPDAALFVETRPEGHYGLLMLLPPIPDGAGESLPRELILVVDTSGSMHGESLQQAKAALRLAIDRLTAGDRFNIIQFNHVTTSLFAGALLATEANRRLALAYVDSLSADGGTEMLPALRRALDGAESSGMLRQVVFLTDGAVGNEQGLFQLISEKLGDSRLFTVGIGAAPNSYFMSRAAEFGRGSFSYIGQTSEVQEKMQGLFRKLESPALTDIRLDWGDRNVEQWPARVPDLYSGEPVLLAVKSNKVLSRVQVEGQIGNETWSGDLALAGGATAPGVHVLWARRQIKHLMGQISQGATEDDISPAVVQLALDHHLVSKYTSLIAVDKTPVRPVSADLASKPVPVNLPHGWSASHVFGNLPQTATAADLHLLIGILSLLSALFVAAWRRRAAA